MNSIHFLQSLQIHDSFFPIGAFSYSDGLETAVTNQLVQDGSGLTQWMETFLWQVFVPCDGLALVQSMEWGNQESWEELAKLDWELTALKPASSVRNSSGSLGKRVLKTGLPLFPHRNLEHLQEKIQSGKMKGNIPVVSGVLYDCLGLEKDKALLCFAYSKLAGMISAALRLLPIGQQEGQKILTQLLQEAPTAAQKILEGPNQPISSFTPLLDIQQMNHPHLYTKLFRS